MIFPRGINPPYDCATTQSVYFSNCGTFNVGCYLYEQLPGGGYAPATAKAFPAGTAGVAVNVFSDGNVYGTVNPTTGLIESISPCFNIYAVTYGVLCSDYSNSTGSLINPYIIGYAYFPLDIGYIPQNSWYRDIDFGAPPKDPGFVYRILSGLGPINSLSIPSGSSTNIFELSKVEYEDSLSGVCNGILPSPSPTPTVTPSITPTPTTTPPPPPPTYNIDWTFTQGVNSGILQISVNGSPVISQSTSGFGSITINVGDSVSIYTYGDATFPDSVSNNLIVDDNGTQVYNFTDTSTFTAQNSYGPYVPTGNGNIIASNYTV